MTSLGFGIVCIWLAVMVLRMPVEEFQKKWDNLTGAKKSGPLSYYQFVRNLFWAVGAAGVAMVFLRFV